MSEYTQHAYARAIVAELRRYLADRFIGQGGPAKAELICEEVFYAERLVPEEAVFEMIERLERMELAERAAMLEFEMRRKAPASLPATKKKPAPRLTGKKIRPPPEGESRDG